MPAIPQASSSKRATHFTPPNPNLNHDESTHYSKNPTLQPSSKIIQTSSHIEEHFLPRRFLGLIPEKIINSNEIKEKKRKFKELKKNAFNHLPILKDHYNKNQKDNFFQSSNSSSSDDDVENKRIRNEIKSKFKIIKRNKHGEEYTEDLNLNLNFENDDDDSNEDLNKLGRKVKVKSKAKKDIWLGESFDIGREFLGNIIHNQQEEEEPPPSSSSLINGKEIKSPIRPQVSTRTTQETFVTARTDLSSSLSSSYHANSSKSTLEVNEVESGGYELTPQPSLDARDSEETERNNKLRNSQSSSTQPLVSDSIINDEPDEIRSENTIKADRIHLSQDGITQKEKGKSISKLKSALRKPSKVNNQISQSTYYPSSTSITPAILDKGKSKSVQFPLDPISSKSRWNKTNKLKGDKEPVHPMEVLERSGEDAIGTSHEAVEEAQEEEEDWEEVKRPGEVILRDRMIAKIGYHREDKLSGFDEAAQRRNPCARLDPLEEYIVVYRKGQIELYDNHTYPLQEKIVGHKHLAFVIPLLPNRTSLSIFNSEDATICLTTSVHKLQDDVSYLMRSNTTRAGAMKDKVKQSKQIRWLRGKQKGSQVFIFKLGERSRSLDWYWEIWRELNGELPDRFDISIPSLSTSIRLFINSSNQEDEENLYEMVGNSEQCKKFEKNKVIENCYNMLIDSSINVKELQDQFESRPNVKKEKLNLQLAWKNSDGNLEWVAYSDTVQGTKRDWNLLSGLARSQGERKPRELQLRPAKHQPSNIKLEDGTLLEEPPGVEGYLTRHKDGSTKAQVYISSHDGNIFVGNFKDAKPPLLPSKESSTPSEIFPDLFKSFIEGEHRRMSSFLEHCSGCIDFRDITSIKFISNSDNTQSKSKAKSKAKTESPQHQNTNQDGFERILTESTQGKEEGKTFEVQVNTGGNVRLEAASSEIAKEWVNRLEDLKKYWDRRHRVDARQRMDAITLHSHENPFTGTELSNESDNFISEIWDWCVIKGCRSTCITGKLFMKKDKWDKFRSKYIVLTGGTLISFKIQKKNAFHTRKKKYPLFGAYVYSGMLALDEIASTTSKNDDIFQSQSKSRVYQDGLQSSDGLEDTTFCIRLTTSPYSNKNSNSKVWKLNNSKKKITQPWENEDLNNDQIFLPPNLSKKPNQLLIFRARSKLERDRWVWAINAEMERQVRSHIQQENILRNYGNVPNRW